MWVCHVWMVSVSVSNLCAPASPFSFFPIKLKVNFDSSIDFLCCGFVFEYKLDSFSSFSRQPCEFVRILPPISSVSNSSLDNRLFLLFHFRFSHLLLLLHPISAIFCSVKLFSTLFSSFCRQHRKMFLIFHLFSSSSFPPPVPSVLDYRWKTKNGRSWSLPPHLIQLAPTFFYNRWPHLRLSMVSFPASLTIIRHDRHLIEWNRVKMKSISSPRFGSS